MPVFVEKIVLPVLAAVVMGLILLNPLKFDWPQRISLFIAVVAVAYFLSHTLHLRSESLRLSQQAPISTPARDQSTGNAATTGTKSPAVTGNDNKITYQEPSDTDKKKTKPQE